jgi:hypothetical protein
VSTLMTERRRSLDNADGQESLFGGEAFALSPGAPASWQRPAPEQEDLRAALALPEAEALAQADEAQGVAFEAHVDVEYEGGPSAEDLAAYTAEAGGGELLVGPAPTEVPAHGAGVELEALERATVADDAVRRPRAPLAGPTLDDLMSRVWEGLATGLPAACPVCHGEVVPSFAGVAHGSCSSCGTTIQ